MLYCFITSAFDSCIAQPQSGYQLTANAALLPRDRNHTRGSSVGRPSSGVIFLFRARQEEPHCEKNPVCLGSRSRRVILLFSSLAGGISALSGLAPSVEAAKTGGAVLPADAATGA
ncbi:hypothetical protein DHEL01_v211823 [Diaporthe helianthi]|uniref:Uncharacterized protein n=1 Tax=Diaporthe helianthi TaxID=158607 RepID=A0A2P5HHS2_DIAHE|nr:hypothetical protein DHEL01_v211823 [Diaporthe helianthi]